MNRCLLFASAATGFAYAFSTSVNAAADDRHLFPPIYTMTPKGVNIQTGRFVNSSTEFSVGTLSFVRFKGAPEAINYESATTDIAKPLGYWNHNHASGIKYRNRNGSTFYYVVVDGKGMEFTGVSAQSPNYLAWNQAAQGWSLSKSGSVFTVTNSNGDAYELQSIPGLPPRGGLPDAYYALTRVDYADGHRLDYAYNASAQPRIISSNRGYAIVLDYNANSQITAACGFNTARNFVSSTTTCTNANVIVKTTYSYDGSLRLSSVTDPGGDIVYYTYTNNSAPAANNLIATISLPNSPSSYVMQNFYGPQPGEGAQGAIDTKPDQVRKQITASGDIWLYRYQPYTFSDLPPQPGEQRDTYSWVTNPNGSESEAKYINGIVQYTWGPEGYFEYQFDGLQPKSVKFTEGNIDTFLVDYAGNTLMHTRKAKPSSGLADIVYTRTYPVANIYSAPTVCNAASAKLCNKPVSVVDERGNQTDYTYDPQHGGGLTETGPAVNGVRPQTRYSYAQRYAVVRSSTNTFVQASSPIWVLTQKAYCKTGNPNPTNTGCDLANDEVVITYEYGPTSGAANNLLLREEVVDPAGLNLRTCYAYDAQGNKIAERKALGAGTTTCPAS
jgi:hypothetical protein